MNEPQDIQIDDWHLKVRVPDGEGPHPVILLIHGLTGDEGSMWVFASRFPHNALLIAPRAPYPSNMPEYGGYSWADGDNVDFASPLRSFEQLVSKLAEKFSGRFEKFAMVGFSQGTVFSVAYILNHPGRVSKFAMLAGFLPTEDQDDYTGKVRDLPVFIAHGTKDEDVSIERSRAAKRIFEAAGARVRYCESETAHKLGANCANELHDFFAS
jgi:phospholipase/carboxylesterase